MCCSHSFNCTMLCDVCIVCIWVALPNSIELCSAVCTHMYMCCSPTFNEAMLCDVCTFVYRLYPHSIEPCQSMCVVYVYVIFFLCDQALWYMVCMNVYVLFICIQWSHAMQCACVYMWCPPIFSSCTVPCVYVCIHAALTHSIKLCHALDVCIYIYTCVALLWAIEPCGLTCVCMYTCCSPAFAWVVLCNLFWVCLCCSFAFNWAIPCDVCMYVYLLFSCIWSSCAAGCVHCMHMCCSSPFNWAMPHNVRL